MLALALLAATSVKLIGDYDATDLLHGLQEQGAEPQRELPDATVEAALDARHGSMRWGFNLMRLGDQAVAGEGVAQRRDIVGSGERRESLVGFRANAYDPSLAAQDWTALASGFTWPTEWALAVIQCESGGNPAAYNFAGPYLGLFQVLNGSTDPMQNALQAHQQFREWMAGVRQTSPWPTCAPVRP